MRIIFILCLFLALSAVAQTNFMPGTDDLPMMDGMIIDENETLSFDTPDGQILNLTAKTSQSKVKVLHFYDVSLTALGWKKTAAGHYKRDNDEIVIQTQSGSNGTLVMFQVTTPNN